MKKELYWIHGSEENPDGVINALQDKGILIGGLWDNPFGRINKVIFGVPGHLASVTDRYDAFFAEVIKPAGIELKPFSEEKAAGENEIDKLKPFDRVVARIAPYPQATAIWEGNIFCGKYENECNRYIILSGGMRVLCNDNNISHSSCAEVHKYEPYMDRYIGTTTPFCEWEKPDGKSNQ